MGVHEHKKEGSRVGALFLFYYPQCRLYFTLKGGYYLPFSSL